MVAKRLGLRFRKWFLKNGLYYRIFWSVILAFSLWLFIIICILTWNKFFAETISIDIDTSYLEWRNIFPSMSICLIKNRGYQSILEYLQTLDPPIATKVPINNYARNLQEYIFTNPVELNLKLRNCMGLNSTCGVDILQLRDIVID